MAAIEFYGFSEREIEKLKKVMKLRMTNLNFKAHIVWLDHKTLFSTIKLNGARAPFVRFFTRSIERANLLSELFADLFTIEVILIGSSTINGITYNFVREIT